MPKNTDGGAGPTPDNATSGAGGGEPLANGERRSPMRGQNDERPKGGDVLADILSGPATLKPAAADALAPAGAGAAAAAVNGAGAGAGAGAGPGAAATASGGRSVAERKKQFLIAPRHAETLAPMGLSPLSFSAVEQALKSSPDIDIIDTVGPKNTMGALADGMGGGQGVLVARMTDQKAGILHQQGQGRLVVERDQYLGLMDAGARPGLVTSVLPQDGPAFTASFIVSGSDGVALPGAEVSMFGSMLPATGVTDLGGKVTLSLFGETAASIRSLYVKPKADYWSFYQRDPDVSADEANTIALKALADWPPLAGFPRQKTVGWGQKAMRMDQLPTTYRGQGIKVAIIDSGAATTHDLLTGIHAGFDIVNKKTTPDTWNQDTLGHGSHCAGVIAGAELAFGIRGFVPEAEIHVCKLFPGGQISQLIDALEYCIDKQIDVVNLSLGGAEASEALEQQIIRARRAGVACIVAAGNSGGPVQYPASSPNVLAVAAIGKLDQFPPDSYHAQTLTQNVDANGYFCATFSCFGNQVGVCGPGVAITSSVPPNNYAAWDGTSMAAPHITGLAALVLAHHPDFQSRFKARGAERVERLFQAIRASAHRVSTADPAHIGVGLPDAVIAVGLQQVVSTQGMTSQTGPIPNFMGNGEQQISGIGGIGMGGTGSGGPWIGGGAVLSGLTSQQRQYLASWPYRQAVPGMQLGMPFIGNGVGGW